MVLNKKIGKIKKTSLIVITILFSLSAFSQTTIDIVRASNYYSKASSNYSSGSYTSALSNLKLAEENLKGKTNKDLEYLKIMTNYRLKNFREAYNLVKVYFEDGYSDRSQYFKNVESYSKIHNIDYEEKLTTIFINLEEKFNLVENTNVPKFLNNLVNRIKNEKTSISEFVESSVDKSISNSVGYCLKKWSNGRYIQDEETDWLELNIKPSNSDMIWYYTGSISGKAVTNTLYKVKVTFSNVQSQLSNNYYQYGYKQTSAKLISGQIRFSQTAYQCFDRNFGHTQKGSHFSGLFKNKFENNNYLKSNSNSKDYKIMFTEEERIILKQDNNFEKFKNKLKVNNLL